MKTAALVVAVLIAWGALVWVFATPPNRPPPIAFCWNGEDNGLSAVCSKSQSNVQFDI